MQERCNLFDSPTQKVDINHLKSHLMIGRASAEFLNLASPVLKGITETALNLCTFCSAKGQAEKKPILEER
jgi:hypothetical protein